MDTGYAKSTKEIASMSLLQLDMICMVLMKHRQCVLYSELYLISPGQKYRFQDIYKYLYFWPTSICSYSSTGRCQGNCPPLIFLFFFFFCLSAQKSVMYVDHNTPTQGHYPREQPQISRLGIILSDENGNDNLTHAQCNWAWHKHEVLKSMCSRNVPSITSITLWVLCMCHLVP